VLFAPPLTLLAMVSPYVIRMSAHELAEVGRTAGDLFAASTVASVVAALATGFWLIPSVGVLRLLLLVGALLLLVAAVCFFRGRQRGLAGLAVVLTAASLALSPQSRALPGKVLLHRDSAYSEVLVLDRPDGRYLLLDGGAHTIASPTDSTSLHEYEQVMHSARWFFDEPGRVLILGLGGGLLAEDYLTDGWKVDAVEIDPVVVAAAQEFFGLSRSDRLRIFTMDARRYLREHEQRYDLILVDVFGSSSIPFHLASAENFALLRERLRPGGLVMMNCEARRWHDPLVDHLATGLAHGFGGVWALPTQEPPNTLGNVLLLASPDADLHWPDERLPRPIDHLADPADHWRVITVNHAWANRFVPDLHRTLWTDDRNGVERQSEPVHRAAREQLQEFFGEKVSE
jgi:spermidine synthase